ncbi:hypothetical protein MIND_00007800 [Mycena indigotica]|uniref:BTB domain-containing protein n=1 Tax=Mycena indigotica TaxID=2126181 RepID=A0A8H6TAI9_9AGAR|nr:uncharacterized protein MIND_00007800 [Mycena indigotica]KAF7314938.1 hypothetical protein MIND_00007800 [Mycena indigotica]
MQARLSPSCLRRVQELWFDDGNLVIQTDSAQYKVYRGTLARHSAVFRDMLSFPQPRNPKRVEGCPIVHLPDAEVEVTPFLKALFEPNFFPPFPSRTTFSAVYGCLRLAHKYGADDLRRCALVHFTSQFRTTLAEWDYGDFKSTKTNRLPAQVASWPCPTDSSYLICCLQLAREVEALWTLPRIFYTLSSNFDILSDRLFHGAIFQGIEAELGSASDQCTLIEGSEKQMKASWDIVQLLRSGPSDDCLTELTCARTILRAAANTKVGCRDFHRSPLGIWNEGDWRLFREACANCRSLLQDAHKAARQQFWDNLPGMYNLPPWERLEELKVDAIKDDLFI